MSEQKRYEIRTLADFLKVPKDKRVSMIVDFLHWLAICDDKELIDAQMSGLLGCGAPLMTDVFTWNDDGVTGLSGLDLQCKDGIMHIDLEQP
jgi:hypothetical protein